MKESIWHKQVVVIAELAQPDVTDWNSPLPLIFSAKWHHYVGFYQKLLQDYFQPFLPYPYSEQNMQLVLTPEQVILDGTQIVAHLFTLYRQQNNQPLTLRCQVRSKLNIPKIDLKRYFKQNLKASTCIRYGKFGAGVITVDMSVNNIDDMFQNFKKNKYQSYMGDKGQESSNLGYRFITENDQKIDEVPVRVVGLDFRIERSVNRKKKLGQWWSQLIGDEIKPVLHGITLKFLNIQMRKLEIYCHPDGFLYLTV